MAGGWLCIGSMQAGVEAMSDDEFVAASTNQQFKKKLGSKKGRISLIPVSFVSGEVGQNY